MSDSMSFGRYANIVAVVLVGIAGFVAFQEEGIALGLLAAAFVAAIAISVHATERMAYVASNEEWHRAVKREEELRSELAGYTVRELSRPFWLIPPR